jgi:hypothetical protein
MTLPLCAAVRHTQLPVGRPTESNSPATLAWWRVFIRCVAEVGRQRKRCEMVGRGYMISVFSVCWNFFLQPTRTTSLYFLVLHAKTLFRPFWPNYSESLGRDGYTLCKMPPAPRKSFRVSSRDGFLSRYSKSDLV